MKCYECEKELDLSRYNYIWEEKHPICPSCSDHYDSDIRELTDKDIKRIKKTSR